MDDQCSLTICDNVNVYPDGDTYPKSYFLETILGMERTVDKTVILVRDEKYTENKLLASVMHLQHNTIRQLLAEMSAQLTTKESCTTNNKRIGTNH